VRDTGHAAVEFPIDQPDGDHIRGPHLQRGQQRAAALGGLGPDQDTDQQAQRDQVRRHHQGGQRERHRPGPPGLSRHPPRVRRDQRHQQRQFQARDQVPRTDQQRFRQHRVQGGAATRGRPPDATSTATAGGSRASPRLPRRVSRDACAVPTGGGSANPCSSCPAIRLSLPHPRAPGVLPPGGGWLGRTWATTFGGRRGPRARRSRRTRRGRWPCPLRVCWRGSERVSVGFTASAGGAPAVRRPATPAGLGRTREWILGADYRCRAEWPAHPRHLPGPSLRPCPVVLVRGATSLSGTDVLVPQPQRPTDPQAFSRGSPTCCLFPVHPHGGEDRG
jgi:hypothetical protein